MNVGTNSYRSQNEIGIGWFSEAHGNRGELEGRIDEPKLQQIRRAQSHLHYS